ncbi:MAG: hypothetical protein OEY70_12495 [Acidimicrobiia bacterium]|nr:hypothetical protein [Acidimicrobiia bacterium]
MLNPSLEDLLAGMADGLAATVLPELAPGPARDELVAAIALTRRVARAVPRLAPFLHADSADLAATLRRLWAALGLDEPADGPVADALALARSLPPEPPPSATELAAADLALRAAAADLAAGLAGDADPPEAAAELRSLLERLAAREAGELRLSPWVPLR